MYCKKIGWIFLLFSLLSVHVSAQTEDPPYAYGIALSGGGALGFAHIGALQALEDCGVEPQVVAGCSMGTLVGSLYANGYTPEQIYNCIQLEEFDKTLKVVKLHFLSGSLAVVDNKHIREFLEKYIQGDRFEDLKKPFYVCVTNLTTCDEEIVSSGPHLHDFLLASAAIPGVFRAIEVDSTYYVDGGVVNNLPAAAIRDQCKTLISVDVLPVGPPAKFKKIRDVVHRSIHSSSHHNSLPGREASDHVIDVLMPDEYSVMSFDDFKTIYQYGYDAAKLYLQNHPELTNK